MESMLNAGGDYIYNAHLLNNSLGPPDPSAPPFGIHRVGSSQFLDTSAQFQQKPASNDRSHGETQSFMISSDGEQDFRRGHVSAHMSNNSKLAEATPVTTTEPRRPQSGGLSNSASLSVNPQGTAKVGKKRSRASRRTPTTLLNTDTSNFRAMVKNTADHEILNHGYVDTVALSFNSQ